MKTRDKIWHQALDLFATNGFDGVSVKEIAAAVGIKDASLYNHYKSKQEIFETILLECQQLMAEASAQYAFPINETAWQSYQGISSQDLKRIARDLFHFYTEDPVVSQFRKLLLIEQNRNSSARELFRTLFIDGALTYQETIFSHLLSDRDANFQIMALHFYSPILLLILKKDTSTDDYEKLLDQHIDQFISLYQLGG